MQVLNKYDKEQLVIELHSQGKTIRQIAAAAHLSFSDIGTIIRREDGHDKDDDIETKDLKNKTKTTQALHLFKSGKNPIDVAIELDISANEMEDMLQEYWVLNRAGRISISISRGQDLFAVISEAISLFEKRQNAERETNLRCTRICRE